MKKTLSTGALLVQLKKDKYRCNYSNLSSYVRDGHVEPEKIGRNFSWDYEAVKKVQKHLRSLGRGPK